MSVSQPTGSALHVSLHIAKCTEAGGLGTAATQPTGPIVLDPVNRKGVNLHNQIGIVSRISKTSLIVEILLN